MAAQVSHFVEGRRVDDDVQVMMRFDGAATGLLWASQVAIGHVNGLRLRVYGETGSLAWTVEEPNTLLVNRLGEPVRRLERASTGTTVAGRMPSGHPEGLIEALAQLYADFARRLAAREAGRDGPLVAPALPDVGDGARGVRFIEAVLDSARAESGWVAL